MQGPPGFLGAFRDDVPARAVYSEAAGIARITPLAVAVPTSADDVVTLVRWAKATRTPLIPRGSGSSMASGAIGPGVIVDLSRLDTMQPVDAAHRRVWVGPGALRDAVDAVAAREGLRFPVDPSSGAFCTIGGMAATNAAGAHALRLGAMRRWVTALDCVFADGRRETIRRGGGAAARPALGVRKNSSGYAIGGELIDLLVGSEGTLALFVGIELALDARPAATASILAAFPTLESAVAGSAAARDAGAAACELLDKTFLDVAEGAAAAAGCPPRTEAVLLIEMEGGAAGAYALGQALARAGASRVDVARDPAAERALWALRHAASPILARLDPALKSMQFIEDGAVPPVRLAEYVRGVREALTRHGVRGVIFGHAGDAHIHVNPLIDTRTPDWRDRVEALLADVVDLTARLGGTLSGEHGDGRLRTPLLDAVWDAAAREWFADVKRQFDPDGILNPGVKVPVPGQRALEDIKYDPDLPALPAAAAAVLARVERDRAYAASRLALLDAAAPPRDPVS